MSARRGFTLIELLVVIAILAILGVVVFAALNPAQRFMDARNARRWSDVNTILTSIHEYVIDNDGTYPTGMTTPTMSETQLGTGDACADDGCGAVANCVDLSTVLGGYLASIPVDPGLAADSVETHYSVTVATGVVTITACDAEDGEAIQVSR